MTNDVLQRNTIRRVYNTPELHGSYCPCKGCESILGPLPDWIHEIGQSPEETP